MPDLANLPSVVDAMRGVKVLCIGDVMLDRYVYGEVDRISPEAPIPVMRVGRRTAMLGGAGNVARNLTALGAAVAFVGVTGDDEAGREVGRLIGMMGSVDPCLVVEPGRQTTVKTRYVAASQQLLRADHETVAALADASRRRLADAVALLLPGVVFVVLSDYAKGVLSAEVVAMVMAAARDAGIDVVVDPKGSDWRHYAGASVVTPNRRELGEAARLPVDGDDQVVAAARRLAEAVDIGCVLATRGRDGMTLVPRDGDPVHLPAKAREVYDVSGAGDTVVATLAAALGGGASLAEAAALANVAAGIVVGKVGTATVTATELQAALRCQPPAVDAAKIMPRDAVFARAERWRRDGLRVGFTNGCFDLLHPGHVALLAQAKAACDRLIVGLNADASVRRLKGPTRPVQPEAARATVLASLAAVDAVVTFEEDTPLDLIAALRPDLLVKGADYPLERVVGADLVRGYGGRVLLAELRPGHGTSDIVARLAG